MMARCFFPRAMASPVWREASVTDTLFRIASISKLFTWTAVMQLAEQGKINLDNRDINDYLGDDFSIPAPHGRPITMRNLMTHTPGWEDSLKDLIEDLNVDGSDGEQQQSEEGALDASKRLETYLRAHLPEQIFPPGTIPAYSNYGAALAGHIVSRVSGLPFEKYVEENIFRRLGMTHSSFEQPLPKRLRPLLSEGYRVASGGEAKPFELTTGAPCGSMSASAADMSRFMIAHLHMGQFNASASSRILRPETARLMHSRAFALVDDMDGMAWGFVEMSRNGLRILSHGGDTQWFHSALFLVPQAKLGLFISYNSAGVSQMGTFLNREAVFESFLDRYFPYSTPSLSYDAPPPSIRNVKAEEEEALKSALGSYWMSLRSQTTIFALSTMLSESTLTLDLDSGDGTKGTVVRVSNSLLTLDNAGNEKSYRSVGALRFREEHGQGRLALVPDPTTSHQRGGQRRWLVVVDPFGPIIVLQQTPSLLKTAALNKAILYPSLAVLALHLVLWPVGALLRCYYYSSTCCGQHERHLQVASHSRLYSIAHWVMFGVCALSLTLIIAPTAWMAKASEANLSLLSSRFDMWLLLVKLLAWLDVVVGVGISLGYAVISWREPTTSFLRARVTQVWNSVLALAVAGCAFFLVNWNFLSFSLNY